MKQAQDAGNSEGKSSAGDKYETSRAMGQLDRDMNAKQLEEAKRELAYIHALAVDEIQDSVAIGSVVICKDFLFFISLGLGSAKIDGQNIVLLSPQAPVATQMNGKKPVETFIFNGKTIAIVDVF